MAPIPRKNEETRGPSAWKQTQDIPVEASTAMSKPQFHEQRNKSLLSLGLGEVYYAALV